MIPPSKPTKHNVIIRMVRMANAKPQIEGADVTARAEVLT